MPTLTVQEAPVHGAAPEPERAVSTLEAEMLLNRLAMQVQQWHHLLATQPAQKAQLMLVSRLLECASRTAFDEPALWQRLVQNPTGMPACSRDRASPKVRTALGVENASAMLDHAADRLMRLATH